MKIAISIPDAIFEASEELSQILGISRSELYSKAVQEYVEKNLALSLKEFPDSEDVEQDWEPICDPRCMRWLMVSKD